MQNKFKVKAKHLQQLDTAYMLCWMLGAFGMGILFGTF